MNGRQAGATREKSILQNLALECSSSAFFVQRPRFEREFGRAYSDAQNRQTLFHQTGDELRKTQGKECKELL